MAISHGRRKSKGSAAERELMHMFWGAGWAVTRAAGSGSTQFPNPDLLAGGNGRVLALEVKATKDLKKYFPKSEIRDLDFFANKFGAEPFVVIRFDRKGYYFLKTEDLLCTEASFVASLELCETKGFTFDKLINL